MRQSTFIGIWLAITPNATRNRSNRHTAAHHFRDTGRYLVVETLPDYYRLLHVHPDAPVPVIKASYRAMMQKMRLHPDLGGDAAVAQQLNEAVATLCDSQRRLAYDRLRASTKDTAGTAPGGTPSATPCDDGSASESAGNTDVIQLPSKPHCPFCLSPYATSLSTSPSVSIDAYDTSQRCSQCHGAATPISHLHKACRDDLRRIYRHDHKTSVLLWTHWPTDAPLSARMTDLSIAGCALEYQAFVAVGTVVLLDSPLLNGIGKIRYSRLDESHENHVYSAGLEFLTLQITAEPGAVFSATA